VNGGVNSIGQRKGVRTNFNLGGAHTANPGDTSWSYDNLGQLTSANHGSNNNIDRAYQYDTIGNRLFAENGAAQIPTTPGLNTTGYTPDALNQYNAITAYNASGVAETPVVPVFDDDGNMTQGPLPVSPSTNCTLVWDAENRLIEVRSASNVTLVKYAYDALSRRVSRSVSASPNSYTLYLYDGWNCIAEWNANPQSVTLTSTRTWGLDLSSTPQGAGGVGGLLSEKQSNNTFYPTYDGNGNISEYLAADGSTAAHYEYDPFGNIVKESYASGYNASSFNYKFSTKPLDQATGLYYYGYRYYDPKTGRWPSRDPIGEEGGMNLYGFVGNDGVNRWDYLGQFSLSGLVGASGSGSYYFPLWGWGGVYVSGSVEIRTGTCTKDSGGTTTYDSISGSFGGGVYAGTPGMRWRIRANMVENLRCCPEPTDGKWEGSINGAVRIGFFVVQVNISGSGITTTGGIQGPERPLDFRGTLGGSVSYKKVRVY
jgi:RHS repeat-associated protein